MGDVIRGAGGVRQRNHVVTQGAAGPSMVFAHGFGCDQNMWRFIEPSFRQTYRTVQFDYVGAGRSDLSQFDAKRYGTLDGYAQDLVDVLEALDLRDAIVVGHSVSAMIGLLAALKVPTRIGTLVMLAPSPCYLNDPPYRGGFERKDLEGLLELMDHNYTGWASGFAPMVMGNADRPDLSAELEGSFCATDRAAAKVFANATFFADNRKELALLDVPTLIVQLRDDAIVPLPVGEYLHSEIRGSQLRVLDISGHCPHLSHPQMTIEAIQGFLARSTKR